MVPEGKSEYFLMRSIFSRSSSMPVAAEKYMLNGAGRRNINAALDALGVGLQAEPDVKSDNVIKIFQFQFRRRALQQVCVAQTGKYGRGVKTAVLGGQYVAVGVPTTYT